MNHYAVLILRRAQKELANLPSNSYSRVKDAIIGLAGDPRPAQSTQLVGRGGWRLRVGDYRIIYDIDDIAKTVTVLHVGHRRDVYR